MPTSNDEILDSIFRPEEIAGKRGKIKHAMNICTQKAYEDAKAECRKITKLLPPDTRKTFISELERITAPSEEVKDNRVSK